MGFFALFENQDVLENIINLYHIVSFNIFSLTQKWLILGQICLKRGADVYLSISYTFYNSLIIWEWNFPATETLNTAVWHVIFSVMIMQSSNH